MPVWCKQRKQWLVCHHQIRVRQTLLQFAVDPRLLASVNSWTRMR
jgi:hypothetical protein